jgi:hypothetical protein
MTLTDSERQKVNETIAKWDGWTQLKWETLARPEGDEDAGLPPVMYGIWCMTHLLEIEDRILPLLESAHAAGLKEGRELERAELIPAFNGAHSLAYNNGLRKGYEKGCTESLPTKADIQAAFREGERKGMEWAAEIAQDWDWGSYELAVAIRAEVEKLK